MAAIAQKPNSREGKPSSRGEKDCHGQPPQAARGGGCPPYSFVFALWLRLYSS